MKGRDDEVGLIPGSAEWEKNVAAAQDAMSAKWNSGASGVEAIFKISESKWTLGDLALDTVPWGAEGNKDQAARERLLRFAQEIRLAIASLLQYRNTAHWWPPETRQAAVSWSGHRVLNGRPELLAELLTEFGRVTEPQARAATASRVGLRRSPSSKTPRRPD